MSSVLNECCCILWLSRGFKKPLLTIYSLERLVLVSGEAWGHIHLKVLSYKYYEILSSTSTPAEIKSILKYCEVLSNLYIKILAYGISTSTPAKIKKYLSI